MKNAKTSIIILTYNKMDYTKKCIESIRKFTEREKHEIIVIDNASNDGTLEWLEMQKDIIVVANKENLGFPKGCNQGIEIATGNEILLLNNDVIVTYNWLKKLREALYSSEEVGAVGPVTNYCSNFQSVPINYKSEEDMQIFARKYNKENNNNREYRLKLVGYCMLIKKEVIDKIGFLDERFTPGNFEDDDYSFRIIKKGYKLLVCYDTFIHHFGSVSFKEDKSFFHNLLTKNAIKFKEKWGFDPIYSTFCRSEIIDLINNVKKEKIKVLEVGAACGNTLLKISNINKTAKLYAIELNKSSAEIASTFAEVINIDVEKEEIPYEESFFDCIIFADVLEHLYNPEKVLKSFKKYLKKDGIIVASIPNVMHISVVKDLLRGFWTYSEAGILDNTHIRFFTFNEIKQMFGNAGYNKLVFAKTKTILSCEEQEIIEKISKLNIAKNIEEFSTYQWLVRAEKIEIEDDKYKRKISFMLRRIENDIEENENIKEIVAEIINRRISIKRLLDYINVSIYKKEKVIIIIATELFKKGYKIQAIKIMIESYKKFSNSFEVVYTLAYLLHLYGEADQAVSILEIYEGENYHIKKLLAEIKGESCE